MGEVGPLIKVRYQVRCDDPKNLAMYCLKLGVKYAELVAGPDSSDATAHAAWHDIAEGRDGYNGEVRYGWCGDQATKLLFNGGVRSHWLNRDEMNGPGSWAIGQNVIWLERLAMEVGIIRRYPTAASLVPGDLFVILEPAHIGVVIGVYPNSIDTLDGNGPGRVSVLQTRALANASAVVGQDGPRRLYWAAPINGLLGLVSAPQVPLASVPPQTAERFARIKRVHPLGGDAPTR